MPSQRQVFLNHLAQTSDSPMGLEVDSAEGIYIIDTSGKKHIDLISGIGVSAVGHRHPNVVKAIQDQLEKHLHVMVYGEYVQSPQVQLAQALSKTLPNNLESVYFVNSGSEAVEGALKLAKRFTGRFEIISCKNAYHGSTAGALSVGGDEKFKRNFRPLLSGIKTIEFGNAEFLKTITSKTAAVIIETVQGEAGVRTATKDYFQELEMKCRKTGTLLILDEIQCGVGRTGHLWAFEDYGIVPDIILSAKGLGGGMPIGSFIASKEIMACLKTDPILGHITTFGGHPVSCAAALATLMTIEHESLLSEVQKKEKLLLENLNHDKIISIRSKGLLMAVEFESFQFLQRVISNAMTLGLLSDWFLFCDNSMRIAPPLTITCEEIRASIDIIHEAIELASKP